MTAKHIHSPDKLSEETIPVFFERYDQITPCKFTRQTSQTLKRHDNFYPDIKQDAKHSSVKKFISWEKIPLLG